MKYYKAEDVIRKRAEDLADTSYWEYGNPKNVDEWVEVAEMEFKDLPTIEVSEDCISREYMKSLGYINKGDFNSVETIREWIDNAPSVVPSRAEGEWELVSDNDGEYGICSICGNDADFTHYGKSYHYCPNCGAKMKGGDTE